MANPREGRSDNSLKSLIGRFDRAMYGDLLGRFGPPGPLNDEYLAIITNSSVEDVRRASHDARNDSGVRPMKPYSDE